ncbi:MAG: hypothetical protein LUF68_04880 [Clostridiales bacterium]|nr:hypothetical protein [Clostridiales bacterium]
MSHKSKESLVRQVEVALKERLAIGESKHYAKQVRLPDGRRLSDTKIYSWATFSTYMKHCNYFAAWCKEKYRCRTLEQCRAHVDEWVQSRVESCSPYTVKMEVSALAKLYDCTAQSVTATETPSRVRDGITRSRGSKGMDKHFSEAKNADLVAFCRSTGLRRSEAAGLRGNQIRQGTDGWYIEVKGKGGRVRRAPVVGDVQTVLRMMSRAGDGLVFPDGVHAAADIHSYRAEYATAVYKAAERPAEALKGHDRYVCRGDRAGTVYDRQALLAASRALGHNRESVVAEHYLRID